MKCIWLFANKNEPCPQQGAVFVEKNATGLSTCSMSFPVYKQLKFCYNVSGTREEEWRLVLNNEPTYDEIKYNLLKFEKLYIKSASLLCISQYKKNSLRVKGLMVFERKCQDCLQYLYLCVVTWSHPFWVLNIVNVLLLWPSQCNVKGIDNRYVMTQWQLIYYHYHLILFTKPFPLELCESI